MRPAITLLSRNKVRPRYSGSRFRWRGWMLRARAPYASDSVVPAVRARQGAEDKAVRPSNARRIERCRFLASRPHLLALAVSDLASSSVLGQKLGRRGRRSVLLAPRPTGARRCARAKFGRLPGVSADRAPAPVVEADVDRWKGIAERDTPVAQGLDAIAKQEPGFDARGFIEGAKMAYEMIVNAFAQGDRKTLKNLLSRDVYDGFERAITEREKRGEKAETTFVSIDKSEIENVEVKSRVAQVTVRSSQAHHGARDADARIYATLRRSST